MFESFRVLFRPEIFENFLASTLVALNAMRIIHFKTDNNIDNNNNVGNNNNNNNNDNNNILTTAHVILTGNSV